MALRNLSIYEIDNVLNKIELIDIREVYEYESGHVPGAKNIPMGHLLHNPGEFLDKTKEYHIICQSGGRSAGAAQELSAKGYNIVNVMGGTGSYLKPLAR